MDKHIQVRRIPIYKMEIESSYSMQNTSLTPSFTLMHLTEHTIFNYLALNSQMILQATVNLSPTV